MSSITRRQAVSLAIALGCVALAGRIWWVNENAPANLPIVHHALGEPVELKGAFMATRDSELTDGYTVCIQDARLCSYNEFVLAYATDGRTPIEGFDTPSIVDTTWLIELDESHERKGGLMIHEMILVPARKNIYYAQNDQLFVATQENLRKGGGRGVQIAIHPGTTYEIHAPYTLPGGQQVLVEDRYYPKYFAESIPDRSFELRLSNSPVCHLVDIDLT